MQDDLGVTQCESHVTTRLRFVQKLTVTPGSLKREETVQLSVRLNESVVSANINLNALNGAFITKDTVSGVALRPTKEKR